MGLKDKNATDVKKWDLVGIMQQNILVFLFRSLRSIRTSVGPGGVIRPLPRPKQRRANHRKNVGKKAENKNKSVTRLIKCRLRALEHSAMHVILTSETKHQAPRFA